MNPIELGILVSRIEALCDEMGVQLRRAAFSPNIRDRLDYSCALFDAAGELCAQAAHIPVHLGSMAYAMRDIVGAMEWRDGDMVILNDPYKGGTHLPDVTVISPCFIDSELAGFVANRAHHADIGADSPGSMPLSRSLAEEGLLISPVHLYRKGVLETEVWQWLLHSLRNPEHGAGDFNAQVSANRRGLERLRQLIGGMGLAAYRRGIREINEYAARLGRETLESIRPGSYRCRDFMDDDGLGHMDIPIEVCVRREEARIVVDFAGTAPQVEGNINCPLPVTAAAVLYVFRCLMPSHAPACSGLFRMIDIAAPAGCLVNARPPAAVVAGNVETSSRIVDAVIGALQPALSMRMPAASQGGMNNLALGSMRAGATWDYYETIGGGMGAHAMGAGLSAVQTHMTNTLNTPIEILEMKYPLRVTEYAVRRESGGAGVHAGGDGIIREFEFLKAAQGTLLSERRRHAPWGLAGGAAGKRGENRLNGRELPEKSSFQLQPGDRLRIETPGGGGYGQAGRRGSG
ncbi:MAG TPA: hydantoinase B/oxoprolinase family protein [Gammaproteobacteria bacterium]|nr:hydantoinase B/oxoprolinase family protein [Gammaproteobacteria bacterium]